MLAGGHTLRRTIRYVIGQRPAIAPGFSLLDVGNYDRKHVPELGGRFAQLRGHWANKSVRDWTELLTGDEVLVTAILDRLLHRAHVLNIRGRSYRLRDLEDALKQSRA